MLRYILAAMAVALGAAQPVPTVLMTAGQPAELQISAAGERSVRVTLKPISFTSEFPATPAVVDRAYAAPAIRLRSVPRAIQQRLGGLTVNVSPSPLTVTVTNLTGALVQKLVFEADGTLAFALDGQPVLGMGEGGPRPAQGVQTGHQPPAAPGRGRRTVTTVVTRGDLPSSGQGLPG